MKGWRHDLCGLRARPPCSAHFQSQSHQRGLVARTLPRALRERVFAVRNVSRPRGPVFLITLILLSHCGLSWLIFTLSFTPR